MAVTDSRVNRGSLKIADCAGTLQEYSCQPTSVAITPGTEEGSSGDEVTVLCGDKVTGAGTAANKTAQLEITAISDFLDCDGFVANSWKCAGVRAFEWTPNKEKDPTHVWKGTVTVQEIPVGGEVNARLQPSITWDVETLFLPPCYGGTQWMGPLPRGFTAPTAPALEWKLDPVGAIAPATLALLKADPTLGDAGGDRPTRDFTTGEFFLLGDGRTHVHYTAATGWATGDAA